MSTPATPSLAMPSNQSIYPSSYSTNSTVTQSNTSKTVGTFSPLSTSGTNSLGNRSTSNSLFSVVFITSVALASFLLICVIILIVCCTYRRKRTAIVTQKKGRSYRLGNSPRRAFVSDGPLYAVTTLNSRRYTGIIEGRQDQAPSSTQSSVKTNSSETRPRDNACDRNIAVNDKHIYERYLTPIDGLPGVESSSRSKDSGQDPCYLQPVDGIPVPDKTPPGTNDRPRIQDLIRNHAGNTAAIVNNNLYDEVSPMVK